MERHALKDAADWFVRLQDRKVNAGTRERFTEWLLISPDHVAAYFEVTQVYGRVGESIRGSSIGDLVAAAKADTEPSNVIALSTDFHAPAEEPTRTPIRRRIPGLRLAIAASLLAVILVASWQVFPLLSQPHFVTQIGEQRSVPLEDGSLVYLNTDSDLTVDLSGPERRITLTKGEARFTVAKDPKRPFIVSTKHASVRALGTIFNVQTGGERTAVSVIEGRIEVTGQAEMTSLRGMQAQNSGHMMQLVLRTGEQAMVTQLGRVVRDNVSRIDRVMAWPNGQLAFRDEPLIDLVTDFNRYHRLPLRISDPELAAHRVSGTFDAYDRLSLIQFLERYEGVRVLTAPDGSQLLTRAETSQKNTY
jgi:transmembrane sensor